MKRFAFSMDPLLRVREHHLEEEKAELGKAISQCNLYKSQISEMGEQRNDMWSHLSPDVDSMVTGYLYLHRLSVKDEEVQESLRIAEAEADKVRNKYLDALKEVRVLEKIKERRKKIYRKEILREEADNLDEVGHYKDPLL